MQMIRVGCTVCVKGKRHPQYIVMSISGNKAACVRLGEKTGVEISLDQLEVVPPGPMDVWFG